MLEVWRLRDAHPSVAKAARQRPAKSLPTSSFYEEIDKEELVARKRARYDRYALYSLL